MEYDEQKAIQYIRDHSEGHANFDDDQLLNVIDMIFDYYDEHGLLDIDVDADGNSDDDDDNEEAALIRHAQGLGNYFIRKGYKVRYPRKGEVAEIIIPSDLLFLPNTAELRPDASKTLGLFKSLVERPQLYKLLVVAHTDNTGSPAYSDALTEDRAMAVFDFLVHLAPDIANNITPYGLGFDEPFDTGATVADSNASIAGRRANRRVEIYIVPTQQTIDMARNGKL